MIEKLPADGRADTLAIERQPFAVVLLQLFHLSLEHATFETGEATVLAIDPVEALVSDGSFEFIERNLGVPKCMAERFGQARDFAEQRQQFGEHAGLLAQLSERCAQFMKPELAMFREQKLKGSIELEECLVNLAEALEDRPGIACPCLVPDQSLDGRMRDESVLPQLEDQVAKSLDVVRLPLSDRLLALCGRGRLSFVLGREIGSGS